MADMVTPGDVIAYREQHPEAAVVCYVNSSAAVKAVSDICCTSSNAVKVVRSLPQKEIIFIPDRNLGQYVSRFVKDKTFIFHPGYCNVHDRITVDDIQQAKADHPGALVLVHPECRPEVVDVADFTGSTAQIIDYTVKSGNDSFIIGTECGVFHRLEQLNPQKRFYSVTGRLTCPNMKMTTLKDLLNALENMVHPVELDPDIIDKAAGSLERMLAV
jgi:Quinolinate synthase